MFTQRVRHLVAHDGGDLVIRQAELIDDAGEEGDLPAGHTERIHGGLIDEDHLPPPGAGGRIPLSRMGQKRLGNRPKPLQPWVIGRHETPGLSGLSLQGAELLLGGALKRLCRH